MTLSSTALVTLNQVKAFLHLDPATSLHIDAEAVGTGNGTNPTFVLDHTPLSGTLKLYVDSVLQTEVTGYTLATATITFIGAAIPGNGKVVTAAYDYASSGSTFEAYDDDVLEMLIEAATKKTEDYCSSAWVARTLTEIYQGNGSQILRLNRSPIISITSVNRKVLNSFLGDGVTLVFTLSDTPKASSYTVYVNGTLKTETTHYAISGTTLTFTAAGLPADDADIVVKYSVSVKHVDYEEQLSIGRLKGSWYNGYQYEVVYVTGYDTTAAAVRALLPDAAIAVLTTISAWYSNRSGLTAESVAGIGSVSYGAELELPDVAKAKLAGLRKWIL
jgi:hypothetical protein